MDSSGQVWSLARSDLLFDVCFIGSLSSHLGSLSLFRLPLFWQNRNSSISCWPTFQWNDFVENCSRAVKWTNHSTWRFNLKVQLDRFPPNCPTKLYAKVWCQTHLNRFFYCFFSLIPPLKWTVQAERDRWTVRLNRWTSAILEFSYFGLQRRSRKLWQKAKRETIIGRDWTNRLTKKLSEQLIAKEKLRKWFIWKMKNIFIKFSSQKSGPAFSSTVI